MTPKQRKHVLSQLDQAGLDRLAAGLTRAQREGWADMVRTPQDMYALAEGCYFDERYAAHAANFFDRGLVHATGRWAGEPFRLQGWQRDEIIQPLFGWRRPDRSRRFRSAFILIAKKNGKSTLCGGLILYQLVGEPDPDNPNRTEQAQEIYAASTSQEVAAIIFREAKKLSQKSPALKKRLEVKDQTRRIVYPATQSFFRTLPHKADSAEGMIAGGVYFDEVHAMKNRKLWAALRWAGASRKQPLCVEITTAGIDDKEALWMERRRYSQRVLAGEHKDISHLAVLYEADKDAQVDDVAQLRKANPSIGVTIDEARLVEEAHQVLVEGPAAIADFKRYRMNIAVGAANGWLSPELWDKAQEPFSLDALLERRCVAGLDLAKVSDFTALALLWPPAELEQLWRAAFWFWIPRAAVEERTRRGDMSYQAWADADLIEVTDGDTTDHKIVRQRINELAKRFNIERIGIDRNFEGWQFTSDLFNDDELPAVGVGQGWKSQDVPMQRIETLVKNAQLNAGGNPVIRWMIGNAIAAKSGPNSNYSLDRARAADKIDGVAALINAMYLAEAQLEDDTPGEYAESPLVILD